MADPQDFVNALGRISGKLLSDNLLRNGTDLAFDTDLLYLKVSPVKGSLIVPPDQNEDGDPNFGKLGSTSLPSTAIGINTDVPIYTLDVNSEANFNNLIVTTQAAIDNIIINAPDQFTTSVGAIQVRPPGINPIMFHDRLTTSALIFDDNSIGSIANQNIVFDPNGTGQFRIEADTNITGDLGVSGNITISGNLSKQGSIFLGDDRFDGEGNVPENDTITINTDFAQSIIPGQDLTYNLGIDRSDSTPRRWSQAHIPDWTNITTGAWAGSGLRPQAVIVSDQMRLDGVVNKISAIQSNEDILLDPDTGIVYVESVKFGEAVGFSLESTLDNPDPFEYDSGNDVFGISVAISGDYAIVGAYLEDDASGRFDSGKAYIYNATTGALIHTLNNPNPFGASTSDYFGFSVAISGDRAIVGAHQEDDASGTDSGKAYIYNVTTGALIHTLNNPNPVGTSDVDNFGYSVAISGDRAIVSAYNETVSGVIQAGRVYVYNVTTGALIYTLNNPAPSLSTEQFGRSIAMSSDYIIVGGVFGKVYIYNATTGALIHTLNNPNPVGINSGDEFGHSVSISGDRAIVGAYGEGEASSPLIDRSGKAYIYNVTTGALVYTLNNPNAFGTTTDDNFGYSVAISGNYAIVGARNEDDIDGNLSGKAYVFNVTTGALFNILDNPNAFGTSNGDRFGYSVAISGDRAIVGAYQEDDASGTNSGKAYIYKNDRSTITNLLNTPLTFASTGIGYTQFSSTNAFVVPSGTTSEQRPSPEVGETRWNTQIGYLECFDGSVWAVSTGGGEEVTGVIMEDLGHAYTLMLG